MPEPDDEPGGKVDRQGSAPRRGPAARRQAGARWRPGPGDRHGAGWRCRHSGEASPATSSPIDSAADDPGERPAGVGGDRLRQDRGEVVGRAPGKDLGTPSAVTISARRRPVCAERRRCHRRRLTRPGLQPQPGVAGRASATARRRSRHRLPPAPARRSSRRRVLDRSRHLADAGLGQHQLHVVGRRQVAGDRRDDRADLLVAGQQQEGRRAAVALDADGVEARLRMESSRWPCGGTEPQE